MYTQINDDNFTECFERNPGRYYSMFTVEGNELVAKLVDNAKAKKHAWNTILKSLAKLAKEPGVEEATDTAVRESVYGKMYPEKAAHEFQEWKTRNSTT
jgi:hypothetical protein